MTDHPTLDDLIPRLRARAGDPERRTSVRPTQLGRQVAALDLGGLLAMAGDLSATLKGVVGANQQGRVDPAGAAPAAELERAATTPVDDGLPAPADEASIARAEAALGVALPPALRRVYAEVADGGFGPGEGLLPLERLVARHRELRSPGMMPRDREWPAALLPVVSADPGWDCVDAATGAVVSWDPEELTERSSEDRFRRSFREAFPSVEAWLATWVGSRTQAELLEIEMATLRANGAYTHIRSLQAMSPQQRASFGLVDGWEAEMAATMGVPWPPPDGPARG